MCRNQRPHTNHLVPISSIELKEPLINYCKVHPSTETDLRCGRCDRYICPQDLTHTPGGIRCTECAQLRRPPMYELAWSHYLRGGLAAAGAALALGFTGALLLAPRTFGNFFYLASALMMGIAAGILVSEAIERATGGKRGTAMQLFASASIVVAAILRLLFGDNLALLDRDVGGAMAALVGTVYAWGRMR